MYFNCFVNSFFKKKFVKFLTSADCGLPKITEKFVKNLAIRSPPFVIYSFSLLGSFLPKNSKSILFLRVRVRRACGGQSTLAI